MQLITIPFRTLVRGFIDNLDTNGILPLAEILEKVNEVELIMDVSSLTDLGSIARYKFIKLVGRVLVMVHSNKPLLESVNEHVSSN